ncbi:hypothetical protein RB594_006839 [Gaeumannomyces avenae]
MALATAPGLGGPIPVPALAAAVDPYAMFPRCRTPPSTAPAAAPSLDPAPASAAATPDLAAQATPGSPPTLPPPHKQRPAARSNDENSGGCRRQSRGSPSPRPLGSRKRRCKTSLRGSGPGRGSTRFAPEGTAADEGDSLDGKDNIGPPLSVDNATGSVREYRELVSTPEHVTRVSFLRWRTRDSWFCFPGEIRNQIYEELLLPPSSYDMYAGYYAGMKAGRRGDDDVAAAATGRGEQVHELGSIRLQTPGILLVCRAITGECTPILRARTLVVDRVPPWPPGSPAPLPVSRFIGHTTLRRLHTLELRVELGRGAMGSGWVWNPLVRDLLAVLCGGAGNELRRLRVVVKLFRLGCVPAYTAGGEGAEWDRLFAHLEWFRAANPMIWSPPTVEVEFWAVGAADVVALEPFPAPPPPSLPAGPRGLPRSLQELDVCLRPWQFRYARARRIGDATDCALVPGSVTEFLAEDPRDRDVVGNHGVQGSGQGDEDEDEGEDDEDDDNGYDMD